MSRKRRNFGASFKAKVALAAVLGDKTTAELARKFVQNANNSVHFPKAPLKVQVFNCQRVLFDKVPLRFDVVAHQDAEPRSGRLYSVFAKLALRFDMVCR